MHIAVDPDLPEDMADALDAKGNVITRFAPSSEHVPARTVALRVLVAAVDRVLATLDESQNRSH